MALVGLKCQTGVGPSDDPVEDPQLLVMRWFRAHDIGLDVVLRLELAFKPSQLMLAASGGEVITVHRERNVTFLVVENAWACGATIEPN